MKKLKACKKCRHGFLIFNFYEAARKYCNECIMKHRQKLMQSKMSTEKNCAFCGKKFFVSGASTQKFCKKHIIHLEGKDYQREIIRRRDNYTCQNCRRKWQEGERRFDVHHLDEANEGWDNKSKNPNGNKSGIYENDKRNKDRMITLCHKCHLNLPHIRERIRKGYTTAVAGNR